MHARGTIFHLAGALLLVSAAAVAAAAHDLGQLQGNFKLVAAESDDIETAIDRAIEPMSLVVQPFARRRLRVINVVYPRIEITATDDAVVVVADPRTPICTPASGAPAPWHRDDGEPFQVRGLWDGAVFEQTFVSGTGRRVNRYSTSADGATLTIDVQVSGGGLPGRMTYRLVYRRDDSMARARLARASA